MIPYIEGAVIGVPKNSPTGQNPVIFINSYSGAGLAEYPPGQWSTVDLSAIVPADTIAVRLDGILIITHGSAVETADMTVAFRTDPSYDYGYVMQTIEASVGNGQRSNAGAWVALDSNLCCQMKWTRATQGQWPANSSYGVNLSLTAYLRPGISSQFDPTALSQQVAALSQQVADIPALSVDGRLSDLEAAFAALSTNDSRLTQIIDFVRDMQ